MDRDLHPAQANILKELLFHNGKSFSALNKVGIGNDHFTFHIKHLTKTGIIEKKGKLYFLTQAGKLYANKLDVDILVMEKFGTPSVVVTAEKVVKGKTYYLIQKRLKEPMYGYWGFINGKVRFGEFTIDAARREFFEETGLKGKLTNLGVAHKIRGPKRNTIKLDHYFFVYLIKSPKGKLKNTKEGKNYWKTYEEIKKLQTFPGFESTLNTIRTKVYTTYFERYVKVESI